MLMHLGMPIPSVKVWIPHLCWRVLQRVPQDDVCPDAGPGALQGVPVRVVAEHRGGMGGDVVADLPQRRVAWRPRKNPLQHLHRHEEQVSKVSPEHE